MLRYGAPAALHWFATVRLDGLLSTSAHPNKKNMLPKILRGEAIRWSGMSEPEAGSDLVRYRQKRPKKGITYILNGQKMWTSCARYMNYIYLVARTDPNAPKHRGISEFITPIRFTGHHDSPDDRYNRHRSMGRGLL